MREIKFRVFDKERNKMTYEDKRHWFNGAYMGESGFLQDCTLTTLLNNPNIDIEIMQYTGLNDKNGKEIYEGDIVTGEESKIICEVVYTEGAMFMLRWNDTKWGNNEYHHYGLGAFTLEVIGNIYEDKHLLEVVE